MGSVSFKSCPVLKQEFCFIKMIVISRELYVTLFCIFQVSCKCVIILSSFKKLKKKGKSFVL